MLVPFWAEGTVFRGSDNPKEERMNRLTTRRVALVLSLAALAAAGCGSSSKSKSAPKPATTPAAPATQSTPAATPTTANGGYAQQIDAALAPLLKAIQGARQNPLSANSWDQVANTAGPAAGQVGAIQPPASVASLHHQLIALLGKIAEDAGAARDAINHKDAAAEKAAGQKVAQDGRQLSALAAKFKAAGYPI